MEYVERRYRSRMGRDAVVFTVSHRESDLWVAVDRGDAAVMAARTEHFLHANCARGSTVTSIATPPTCAPSFPVCRDPTLRRCCMKWPWRPLRQASGR